MNEPVILDDRKRVRLRHACGFVLIAYPFKEGGILRAGFAAVRGTLTTNRGQTVQDCPQCAGDLRMSWEEFQAALGDAFRP